MDGVRESKQSVWRRLALGTAIAALLSGACLSGNAWAERGERRGDGPGAGAGFDRFVFPGAPRDQGQREALRDDRRQQRRMSEEQRQQLRRDIDEAGRNIYRRPRRFPNE
ncbi:MAG: hypothetical protein IPL03_00985 [Sterolibacteriaceae bacterium]|nr:hypothetical protein [Candidatus Methylophosphatis haderslevensis]